MAFTEGTWLRKNSNNIILQQQQRKQASHFEMFDFLTVQNTAVKHAHNKSYWSAKKNSGL